MSVVQDMYNYHISRWGRDEVVLSPEEYISYLEACGNILYGDGRLSSDLQNMQGEVGEYMSWASELLSLEGREWGKTEQVWDSKAKALKTRESTKLPKYSLVGVKSPMLCLSPSWHKFSSYPEDCSVPNLVLIVAQLAYMGKLIGLGRKSVVRDYIEASLLGPGKGDVNLTLNSFSKNFTSFGTHEGLLQDAKFFVNLAPGVEDEDNKPVIHATYLVTGRLKSIGEVVFQIIGEETFYFEDGWANTRKDLYGMVCDIIAKGLRYYKQSSSQ